MLVTTDAVVNINICADIRGNVNQSWTPENLELYAEKHGVPFSGGDKGAYQIYIDPKNTLGNSQAYTLVESNGTIVREEIPSYIILGHEMIHVERAILNWDNNTDWGYELDYNKGSLIEEYETVGINYLDHNRNLVEIYNPYGTSVTENGIRFENGLNTRISILEDFPK